MYNIEDITNKILCGDSLAVLKQIPDESIDMCLTSPPYYGLRNYKIAGQLGQEETDAEYLNKLCDIMSEVKRVLRRRGTCWVNIGTTMKDKDDLMIPERFALEMRSRGWIKRRTKIWRKPNCMPSSVSDDTTLDFEYVYFFVKSKDYYYEQQFEPHKIESIKRACRARTSEKLDEKQYSHSRKNKHRGYSDMMERVESGELSHSVGSQGRHMRSVWDISTGGYRGTHMATFPEKLCNITIQTGCPKFLCNKCGKAREKVYVKDGVTIVPPIGGVKKSGGDNPTYSGNTETPVWKESGMSDCGCAARFSRGIVLDPFMGAGTTGLVALKLNRKFVGIELNPDYIKMAEDRLHNEKSQMKLELI